MRSNNSIIGIVIGIAGVAYGLYSQQKMNKVASKLNMTINEIDATMAVDIPKNVVKSAMDQAVTREVSQLVKQTASEISEEVSTNMKSEVTQAINNRFGEVSEQVSTEVAKINTDALSAKVTKKAEQLVVSKFDSTLDGLVDTFNRDLKRVGKMYYSMTETMFRPNDTKSMFFR